MKALILDRDGLLNECSYYITDEKDLILKSGVKEAIEIIKKINIKVVLATKQRCISKGLVTLEKVRKINLKLEHLLDFKFDNIFIEQNNKLKTNILGSCLNFLQIPPSDILFIDDDEIQCVVANILGFQVCHTDNLIKEIKKWEKF